MALRVYDPHSRHSFNYGKKIYIGAIVMVCQISDRALFYLIMLFSAKYLHSFSKKLAKAWINWLFHCHFNLIVLQYAVEWSISNILYS